MNTPPGCMWSPSTQAGFPEEADRPKSGDAASGGLRRDGRASRAGGCRQLLLDLCTASSNDGFIQSL